MSNEDDETKILENYDDGKYDQYMNEDTYKGMTALEKEKILEEKQAKEQQDNYMRSLKERKTYE